MVRTSDTEVEIKKNINVGVRVRPLNAKEIDGGEKSAWEIDPNLNKIQRRKGARIPKNSSANKARTCFEFDQVYDVNTATEEIYDRLCKNLVVSGMEGINGTIFAYGQTSSGKTYTMKGTETDFGIIPIAVNQIFEYISTNEKAASREYLITVSYLEIYNEKMMDLLRPQSTNLQIKEDRVNGVVVRNLHENVVCSVDEVLRAMYEGEQNRHFAETLMNKNSSRSHTIFRIKVESRKKLKASKQTPRKRRVRVSCLNFVDLAGSERLSQTGAQGDRAAEGMAINKSLMFLGVVIRSLAEKAKHVPFRDSTLTRILQTSLGGNSQTAVIANISPAESNVEHTINTLRFATRAVRIQNKAKINLVSAEKSKMSDNEEKIANLKSRLSMIPDESEVKAASPTKDQVETKRLKKMLALRLQHLQNLILCSTEETKRTARAKSAKSRHNRRLTSLCLASKEPSSRGSSGELSSESITGERTLKQQEQMFFRVESLQSKNKLLEAEIAQVKDENQSLRQQHTEATNQQLSAEAELSHMRGQNLHTLDRKQLEQLETTLSVASRRVLVYLALASIKGDRQDDDGSPAANAVSNFQHVTSALKLGVTENEREAAMRKEYQFQLDAMRANLDQTQATLNQKEQENEGMKAEAEKLERSVEQLSSKAATLESDAKKAKAEAEDCRREMKRLKELLRKKDGLITGLTLDKAAATQIMSSSSSSSRGGGGGKRGSISSECESSVSSENSQPLNTPRKTPRTPSLLKSTPKTTTSSSSSSSSSTSGAKMTGRMLKRPSAPSGLPSRFGTRSKFGGYRKASLKKPMTQNSLFDSATHHMR